jgi:predicted 3-demethylubiquinone-9 3-methyltransferase (glyoxalase superfamily)
MSGERVAPCLWFDGNARQAADFYVSLLPNSKIVQDAGVMVVFELDGRRFMGLNGGPEFKFSEAVSIYVDCADQAEVDRLWNALTADGGSESQCGWLKDRFGLSWQIIPEALPRLLGGPDRESAGRAMQAMFKMKKIDVAALEAAYNGG